mgnify:CR=1 FL=1
MNQEPKGPASCRQGWANSKISVTLLVENDIRDMADEFGKHTQANGRIVFGLGRTKKLTGVMHWIQDCHRASDIPNHENFD